MIVCMLLCNQTVEFIEREVDIARQVCCSLSYQGRLLPPPPAFLLQMTGKVQYIYILCR